MTCSPVTLVRFGRQERDEEREVFISQGFMSLSFLPYILYLFFLRIKPGVVFIREGEDGIRLLASGRILVSLSPSLASSFIRFSGELFFSAIRVRLSLRRRYEQENKTDRQTEKKVVGKVQTKRTQREKGIVMTAASFSCLLLLSKEGNSLR